MAISSQVIKNQYILRKTRELQSEKQLASFLEYSFRDNILADINTKRRLACEAVIQSMDIIKKARIEQDTALDLTEAQKLHYKYSALDRRGLESALDKATSYQEVCVLTDAMRARGFHDLADNASNKAVIVGEKKHLNSPDYQAAVKAVKRVVEYSNMEFYCPDLDSIMDIEKPRIIPIKQLVLSVMGPEPDAIDMGIAEQVANSLGGLPDVLTPDLRQTLSNLDK